jgi:hypothetical protein
MSELLVTVSMRFPGDVDQYALSALVSPVVRAAVAAGGLTTNLSVQPYDSDEAVDPSPAVADSQAASVLAGEEPTSVVPLVAQANPCALAHGAQGEVS